MFKILIIEDDKDDVDWLESAIHIVMPQAHVKTFISSLEAITFLYEPKNHKEFLPNLILLDLNMHQLDGKAILSLIKVDKELRDIPVVILTTSSNPNEKKELLGLSAKAFFTKPTSEAELIEVVKNILTNHVVIPKT